MSRNAIIAGVVIALLLVGGVYGYQWLFPSGGHISEVRGCATAGCDWTGPMTLRKGDPFPPVCPKCRNNTVLAYIRCPQCDTKMFRATDVKAYIPGNEKIPDETRCPKCNAVVARS